AVVEVAREQRAVVVVGLDVGPRVVGGVRWAELEAGGLLGCVEFSRVVLRARGDVEGGARGARQTAVAGGQLVGRADLAHVQVAEIGRASCRESARGGVAGGGRNDEAASQGQGDQLGSVQAVVAGVRARGVER